MGLADLNIGVLFILGISGLGVYGVALAGWASNNKYALMVACAFDADDQLRMPMALALVAPLLMLNTLSCARSSTARKASTSDSFPGGAFSRCRSRSSASSCSDRGFAETTAFIRSAGSGKRTGAASTSNTPA